MKKKNASQKGKQPLRKEKEMRQLNANFLTSTKQPMDTFSLTKILDMIEMKRYLFENFLKTAVWVTQN